MLLDIMNTKVYLISPGTHKYEKRVVTVFERLVKAGFKRVEFFRSIPSHHSIDSLALTVVEIFKRELYTDQPFIILEDDCEVWHPYDTIHIPDNFSMLYLGVSAWAYPHSFQTVFNTNRPHIHKHNHTTLSSFDQHLVSVKGMTGGHAILYTCRKFMKVFIDLYNEHNFHKISNVAHDLIFSALLSEYNAYALKKPMFYQDKSLGGQEEVTKLVFDGVGFS